MTDHISPAPLAEGQPWTLYVGDARAVLTGMPDQSANCIVTSPPYWGKRDYGVAGQYGHGDTPAAYVETMREVFREARRVLADDGTCWLNLGDSYSSGGGGATGMHAYLGEHITTHRPTSLGVKNLLGQPWQIAFALQADSWILRNAIVWHKPNAMPESVRDRLNCRHELLFLLVKSPAYWFDLDPIREPHKTVHQREPGPPVGVPVRQVGRVAVPGRRSTGRIRARSPRPAAMADPATAAGTPTGATPGTSGPSPPAPTTARTSPPTRSTCCCGASPPGASRAGPCSTRSSAAAPPGSPRSSSTASSPGSTCHPTSRGWRPGGSRRRSPTGGGDAMNSPSQVTTRNDIARDIIAGFAAVTPHLAGIWRILDQALADLPATLADLGRVRAELEAVRLDRANLLAAIRATLAADAEGECNSLGYLLDELASTDASAGTRRQP